LLKEINPAIEKTLSETIERLRGTDEMVEGYIRVLRESLAVKNGDNWTFKIDQMKNHLHCKSILFELFSPFDISGSQLDDLADVIKGRTGGQLFTPSHRIIKDRSNIVVLKTEQVTSYTCRADNLEELRGIHIIQSAEVITLTESFVIHEDPLIACLDIDEITFPVIIRTWNKGDFFFPLGMRNKKKLSDFFIDRKLSLPGKEKVMVLESGGRIVWVIGHRIDGRFRIKPSTIRALIIKSHSE
jgi:tRNA(Ile)-lysidine synthase